MQKLRESPGLWHLVEIRHAQRLKQFEGVAVRDDELWREERRLWLDSVVFFRDRVGPDPLLVLPGGIVDRHAALAAARNAVPWTDVTLSNQRSVRSAGETMILGYEAQATRCQSDLPYRAFCSSAYVRIRGSWLLIAHHRTELLEAQQYLTERGALQLFFATGEGQRVEPS